VTLFGDNFRGKRVLVTGHTGFKGAWLSLWLTDLGAEVTGVSLSGCDSEAHAQQLQLPIKEHLQDIRNYEDFAQIVKSAKPDIVFHLAAQSLVRRSYREPLDTWSTNLQGTANVLEACRTSGCVRACIVVTTDKVYENKNWQFGYREIDELGGHDPYSASKAATELLVSSFRRSFGAQAGLLIATARAGNVIGGGDASEDRIIPDAIKAIRNNSTLIVRNPGATRPWQHVLEPISGYLMLASKLLQREASFEGAWNFGPSPEGNQTVRALLQTFEKNWTDLHWKEEQETRWHEANLLYLNTDKARTSLGWRPVWSFETAVAKTAQWYKALYLENRLLTLGQLRQYIDDARNAGACWCQA
jgi:CDP-glucose 4,6-dehydratase